MFNLTVDTAHTFYIGQDGWLVHNTKCSSAAGQLAELSGKPQGVIQKELKASGFTLKKKAAGSGNETWVHADGSEVLIHPYGDQKTAVYVTGNNAHLHKNSPISGKLDDQGVPSTDPWATHIGIPNPPNLPAVRGRPHGQGIKKNGSP